MERQIWNLDEGSTITMAQMILDGRVLFSEAADNRPPLVPYLKALVLAVAGDWNTKAIHTVTALLIGLTAVLLWLTARRLGHETAGVLAACTFFWLSAGLIPPIDSLTAHTGWFIIFFSSLGFWFFAGAVTKGSCVSALAAGVAFGFSYLAKQPGLLDFGITLVILLLLGNFDRASRPFRLILPLLAGFLAPLIVTVGYFHYHGALKELFFYAWTYNTKYYVPEVPLLERLAAVSVPFKLLITRAPLALVLGIAASVGLLWTAFGQLRRRPAVDVFSWLVLGWSATGLFSTMLSGRPFGHYSIQTLPGFSLACGWILARWIHRLSSTGSTPRLGSWRICQGVIVVFFTSLAVSTWVGLSRVDMDEGGGRDLGRLVREQTRPQDSIFIWGYMPELYVYSQRLPSTRFFYTNWVTGMIPWTNLDWFTDTTYAIIPGTPEALREDFERNPPGMVVDTASLRGYVKYPLQRQTWLWEKIQYEFAEVDIDKPPPWGFRLYRRINHANYGAPVPSGLPIDDRLKLEVPGESPLETITATLSYPQGTEFLELYKDGELYRRIECPPDRPGKIAFHLVAADLPLGERRLQAVAGGRRPAMSEESRLLITPPAKREPEGPLLEFGGRRIAPIVATSVHREMKFNPKGESWSAHAPAKVVYDRPEGLYGIDLEYGLDDRLFQYPDRWGTDGVELVVNFENTDGETKVLFRRHLNAGTSGTDQGLQRQPILLPLNERGRIIIWFSPGDQSDPSSDWAYIKAVRGIGPPINLSFNGTKVPATRIHTPLGMATFTEQSHEVLMVHAPSEIDFPLQPGMRRLTATYGLLPAAWTDIKGSAGAFFEMWHVPNKGEPKLIHRERADPRGNPAHRGLQTMSAALPYPREGFVRLFTRPAHLEDNAFNYTYWGALEVERFKTYIDMAGERLANTEIEAQFGYDDISEGDKTVLLAHAPSRIVFDLPGGHSRFNGQLGLLAAAYSQADRTDGGRFVVEFQAADGTLSLLLQRDLDPQAVPDDRGFISFSVDLPSTEPARLILRTEIFPGRSINRAWTFWSDLQLSR